MTPPHHNNALRIYVPPNFLANTVSEDSGTDVDHSSEDEALHFPPRQPSSTLRAPALLAAVDNRLGLGGARAYTGSQLREEVILLRQRGAARRIPRCGYRHVQAVADQGATSNTTRRRRRSSAPDPASPPLIRETMRAVGRSLGESRVDDEDSERYPSLPRGTRRELELALHHYPSSMRELVRAERVLETWNDGDSLDGVRLAELPYPLMVELRSLERMVQNLRYAPDMRGAGMSFLPLN